MAAHSVVVRYHWEPEGWWADSPDVPGFSAAADTFEAVREMAVSGIREYRGSSVLIVEEALPMTPVPTSAAEPPLGQNLQAQPA